MAADRLLITDTTDHVVLVDGSHLLLNTASAEYRYSEGGPSLSSYDEGSAS